MNGRVLIIAGSDSSGGAGIQADIKTVTALGGYAATAVTALTAQNTEGVFGVLPVAPEFVRRQMQVVLTDIGADCIKTGMLVDRAMVEAVAQGIAEDSPGVKLVIDPVIAASSGTPLLAADALEILKTRLIARASVVTPNLPEAELLTGQRIGDLDDMRRAAEFILRLGAGAVVLKGGHLPGEILRDLVIGDGQSFVLEAPRIVTRHTHGTGCTLASAIATGLAQGMDLKQAVERAHGYVQQAIRTAPGLGRGNGPLNHAIAIGACRAPVS